MNKKDLRRHMAERKRALSREDVRAAGERLAEQLSALPEYASARTLYCTLSVNQEVSTTPVIRRARRDGKRIAVPKIAGRDMVFIPLNETTPLAPGAMGIPEPLGDGPADDDPRALILVPGLAFDRRGHRVGYGGGYYDRFLADHPGHPTVALCYGFQRLERLEAEEHDVPVDRVLFDEET